MSAPIALRRRAAIPAAVLAVALALAPGAACAVAGGGGGFDLGGGDGELVGLLIELAFWLILELPFPWNLIVLAIVGAVFWKAGRSARASSGLNRIAPPSKAVLMADAIDPAFLHRNPDFAVEAFRAKVRTAFLAIQAAWSVQDLAPVRRFISDGVWQRFNTQIAMMRLLEQRNRVGEVVVHRIFLDRTAQDGAFDLIHVGIHFSARDDFVSARHPELDQTGPVELLEYWTFLRRSGVAGQDLYASNLCPACGAPLPADLGEVARCASCGAVSTLGDYDWVLAEITQADDYANAAARLARFGKAERRIADAFAGDPDFALQLVEDKASNAYLQILGAQVLGAPARLRRFTGDALFADLSARIEREPRVVYNRLYLNHASVVDHHRAAGRDRLVVALRATAQRVALDGGALRVVDPAPLARDEVMVLERDAGAGRAKGSLYAHACPACGAPLGDTQDLACAYCGSVVNSTAREWIVTRLAPLAEYRAAAAGAGTAGTSGTVDTVDTAGTAEAATTIKAPPVLARADGLDPLFAARDFAFNNVLAILGADGALSDAELDFAHGVARRFGYDARKVAGMIELARARRLPLRLPEDARTIARMLRLMERAAAADGGIAEAERAVLDEVRRRLAR